MQVELVEPTLTAALAVENVRVGPQVLSISTELGSTRKLLWDPITEKLVVVGEGGVQLFRRQIDSTGSEFDGQWFSLGVITTFQGSSPCTGQITDAALRVYREAPTRSLVTDTTTPWRSQVAFLVAPHPDFSNTTRHCWLDLDGLDSEQAVSEFATEGSFGVHALSALNIGDCSASFNEPNTALGYNALNDTFWALSPECIAGYRTQDANGQPALEPMAHDFTRGTANPVALSIDPHSGIGLAKYRVGAWSKYKKFVLNDSIREEPNEAEYFGGRDLMLYDPVRHWNWEVVNFLSNDGQISQKNYLWLPSVGPTPEPQFDDAFADLQRDGNWGINHGVLDSSRNLIHYLRRDFDSNTERVRQELQVLATDGSNITKGAAESIVYEAFSESEFPNEDPAKSIILIGPQITGPLPQTIRPGDYVTLLGRNFSADVSQDKVCIQILCRAPVVNAHSHGLSCAGFQDLDVPVKAFVTVDNGRYMSGPAPGRSMLEKRYWAWGARGTPDWPLPIR